jgi:tetratricopeptide (TPR) repeat protein
MNKAIVGVVLAALVVAAPVVAQQNGIATRVSAQLGGKFQDAECQLKEGHFLVSSAKTKLSTYATVSDPVIGARLLREGTEIIRDATTTKGQEKNGAAWYWLARINLLQGDMPGADSSFTRAATLAAPCKTDIQKYRTRAWSALVVGAQEFVEQKNTDSATVLYRAANQINREAPHGFNGLAGLFYDAGKMDSAIAYFNLAAATTPTDPTYVKVRNKAAYNAAVLLLNGNRYPEAVAAFRRYLGFEPSDIAAKKALAQAFRGAGMPDSAQVLERELVASAGNDAGGATGDEGVSEDDLMGIAIKQFNDKNYKEAAATFGRVLALNPANRDALFNQANAYLALQQGGDLSAAAEKLIEIEPFSEYDHTLRAQGYKLAGNQDGLFKAIVDREALVVNIEILNLKLTADGATLVGRMTGRDARDENNKQIPARALTLVVEFLGKGGTVVASQEVQVPPLAAGQVLDLNAVGKGAGVKGWRYRVK